MNGNKIFFTYNCASESLVLKGADKQVVPVFDPAEITDILKGFSGSDVSVEVKLSNRRNYLMEISSAEPKKTLNITLTEITD